MLEYVSELEFILAFHLGMPVRAKMINSNLVRQQQTPLGKDRAWDIL